MAATTGIHAWRPDFAVRTFGTKEECAAYVDSIRERGTNPDFPHLRHVISTAVTWRQVNDWLLVPAARDTCALCRKKNDSGGVGEKEAEGTAAAAVCKALPAIPKSLVVNRFAAAGPVLEAIATRLALPFHTAIPVPAATRLTAQYLFHHMRSAIYVKIRDGALRMFVPFANKNYKNNVRGRRECDAGSASVLRCVLHAG